VREAVGLNTDDNEVVGTRRRLLMLIIGCGLAATAGWVVFRPAGRPPVTDVSFLAPPTTLVDEPLVAPVCDHVVDGSVLKLDGAGEFSNVEPGDVICLQPGRRPPLKLVGFQGDPDRPIVFVNGDGVVTIVGTTNDYAGIDIEDSEFIRVTGTGTGETCGAGFEEDGQACGIVIEGTGRGVAGTERTGHLEVDHVEVRDTEKSGIFVRTNSDGGIRRGDWVQQQTFLHHNFIRRAGTEGIYLGGSSYEEGIEPVLEGVDVSTNLIVDTGWDGLQVGSAVAECTIHHNRVVRASLLDVDNQKSGIMVNPGSTCDVVANTVLDSVSRAIYVQGNGGNRVYNNLIVRAGLESVEPGDGIVISTGSNTDNSVFVWHNTIVEVGRSGILFKNEGGASNQISNNLIAGFARTDPGADAIDSRGFDNVDIWANLSFPDAQVAGFDGDSYRLSVTSPAVDRGFLLDFAGLRFDLGRGVRPAGDLPDIGAYERGVAQ
jgi:hypothetical protein